MNRRGFLGAALIAFAPMVALTPTLANGRSVQVDWALLQEDVIVDPQEFGWLYRALVSVNGRAIAVVCPCGVDIRKSPALMRVVRATARTETLRYYKENK